MFKLAYRAAAFLVLAGGVTAGPAAAALGPDASACDRDRGPALLVTVDGFKARTGNLRVNVYPDDPSRFLARGRYVRQINLRVTRDGAMPVCVALPRAGRYAVAVRHDVDGDGNDWGDGGGYSRNPRLSLARLRPGLPSVALDVGSRVIGTRIVLNYRFGLSVRPVRS